MNHGWTVKEYPTPRYVKSPRRPDNDLVVIGVVIGIVLALIIGLLIGFGSHSTPTDSTDSVDKTGYLYFSPEGFCRTFRWYGGYYPSYVIHSEKITFLCHNGEEITYPLYKSKKGEWVVETPPTLVEDMKSQSYFWYDCDFDNGNGQGQIFYDMWAANDAYKQNCILNGFGNPEEQIKLVRNNQGWYSLHLGNTVLNLGKYDVTIALDDGAMLISAQALSQLVYNHTTQI